MPALEGEEGMGDGLTSRPSESSARLIPLTSIVNTSLYSRPPYSGVLSDASPAKSMNDRAHYHAAECDWVWRLSRRRARDIWFSSEPKT